MLNIEERKSELRLLLADIRVEAKHLISNIDAALDDLDKVETEEDAIKYDEKLNIEHGLKHIEIL